MKTSIIIPCHSSHFPFLNSLLKEFEKQSLLPDEIIISISQIEKVDQKGLEDIKKAKRPFKTTILTTKDRKTSGENRNIASKKASGDILIYQDMDDIPHRQRVEIIHHFFKEHTVDALYHRYEKDHLCQRLFEKESINFFYAKKFFQIEAFQFHLGSLAIRKKVFERLLWPTVTRRQDLLYQLLIFDHFKNVVAINASLLNHRVSESTLYKKGQKNFTIEEIKKIYQESEVIRKIHEKKLGYENNLALSWIYKNVRESRYL